MPKTTRAMQNQKIVYSIHLLREIMLDSLHMVAIAQLVEHLIVVQKVACSSHVSHPGRDVIPVIEASLRFRRGLNLFLSYSFSGLQERGYRGYRN